MSEQGEQTQNRVMNDCLKKELEYQAERTRMILWLEDKVEALEEKIASLEKALKDINEEIPKNPKLPICHKIREIAKQALSKSRQGEV